MNKKIATGIVGGALIVSGAVLFGGTADTDLADISARQDEYFQRNQSYSQVLKDNQPPSDKPNDQLGRDLPANMRIDVYDGPTGKGYQVIWEENGMTHSKGYGSEAEIRTYDIRTPIEK